MSNKGLFNIQYDTIQQILKELKFLLHKDRDEVITGKYTFEQTPDFPSNPFQKSGRLSIDSIESTIVVDEKLTFYTPNSYGLTLANEFEEESQIGLLIGLIGGERFLPQKFYHLFVLPNGKQYFRVGTFNGTTATWTDLVETNLFTDAEKLQLSLTSGTNTGDQDLSALATKLEVGAETTAREQADIVLTNLINTVSGGYLGVVAHDAASAPEPGVTGYYEFSSAGVVAWLDGTPTVAVGDRLSVLFDDPTYTYTVLVDTSKVSTNEQTLSNEQKTQARTNIGAFAANDVAGELGDSETKVMSQKAVTDELAQLASYVSVLNTMFMRAGFQIKDVTSYNEYGIPNEYNCVWEDGTEGRVVLSNFDENVFEYRRKKAYYRDIEVDYGDVIYDENGYILSQSPTLIN